MTTDQKLGTSELLYRAAEQMGLQPSWLQPNGLLAIWVDGQERYLNLSYSVLNSHISVSLARDKYLTRLVLERHNMQNIPFARPSALAEAEAFLHEYKKIIAKPVRGGGARDIHIVTDAAQLRALDISEYILEKYIAGKELRYLIINDAVIGVHRSDYGTSVDEHRALERISYPQAAWDPGLIASSLKIARVLGLKFAAVDFLVDDSGLAHILEVNTIPGLKWFHSPTSGPKIDVARLFLEAMMEDIASEPSVVADLLVARPTVAYS